MCGKLPRTSEPAPASSQPVVRQLPEPHQDPRRSRRQPADPRLGQLPAVLRLLAANNSGELVKSRVANDAGIPETSLPPYLDLLETLFLIHTVPAWGENLTKRVTGRPKVLLLDTGLAARLNNVTAAAMAPGVASNATWPGPNQKRGSTTSATATDSKSTWCSKALTDV